VGALCEPDSAARNRSADVERVMLITAVASGATALVATARSATGENRQWRCRPQRSLWRWRLAGSGDLIAYGRNMKTNRGQSEILYLRRRANSSVAITEMEQRHPLRT